MHARFPEGRCSVQPWGPFLEKNCYSGGLQVGFQIAIRSMGRRRFRALLSGVATEFPAGLFHGRAANRPIVSALRVVASAGQGPQRSSGNRASLISWVG